MVLVISCDDFLGSRLAKLRQRHRFDAACDARCALVIGTTGLPEDSHAAIDRAARNIADLDVLPSVGANVYDILRREKLVLTRAAIEALEARFK